LPFRLTKSRAKSLLQVFRWRAGWQTIGIDERSSVTLDDYVNDIIRATNYNPFYGDGISWDVTVRKKEVR